MASETKGAVFTAEHAAELRLGAATVAGTVVNLAKAVGAYPHIPQVASKQGPTFDGSADDFLKQHVDNHPVLRSQMKNKIKKCPKCSKVVAFTLDTCNGCGASMKDVPLSESNNIFTSFIYGIARGPFPFTISVRHQSENMLVFDDLLSLAPCHINVVPTSSYIPDWRWLLSDPERGLVLLNQMSSAAWNVFETQFASSKEWRAKIYKDPNMTLDQLKQCVATGFNYPPSQYQLHLQYCVLPMFPVVYGQYLSGVHFTKNRFFPLEYVREVLKLGVPYPVQETTSVEDIISFYAQRGVDYNVIHAKDYSQHQRSQEMTANWQIKDFDAIASDSELFAIPSFDENKSSSLQPHPTLAKQDPKTVAGEDKMYLQNYGRPYAKETGKPTGSYYAFAKAPGTLPVFQPNPKI